MTSNDLALTFTEPFASVDGELGKHIHYDLGVRGEESSLDNVDKIDPANSFSKLAGLTLPKATFTLLPPDGTCLPSVAFSYGEAFHTNDPRIGNGTEHGTVYRPLPELSSLSCRIATPAKHEKFGGVPLEAVLKTRHFAELFRADCIEEGGQKHGFQHHPRPSSKCTGIDKDR